MNASTGWMAIDYDQTNSIFKFLVSADGAQFIEVGRTSDLLGRFTNACNGGAYGCSTGHFTTAADQVGLAIGISTSTAQDYVLSVDYFRVIDIPLN